MGIAADRGARTIQQFVEYLETFSRYKQNENLHAMSGLLDSHSELTSVEKAMLGRLIRAVVGSES